MFQAPYDTLEGKEGWMMGVRHYATQIFLYYMESIKGMDTLLLISHEMGNYENPQSFWFDKLGSSVFRDYFADYASEISADFNFLTRDEYNNALHQHMIYYGDWRYAQPSVWNSVDEGTDGQWYRPQSNYTSRGWAWNVFNITNTDYNRYRFVNHITFSIDFCSSQY